jgi:hypothetical protein
MTAPLPQPRALLTSLISSLPAGPPPGVSEPDTVTAHLSNPLQNLPASARHLLTTLHVLLVPGQLWQALDLLDRGLVTRVVHDAPSANTGHLAAPRAASQQVRVHIHDHGGENSEAAGHGAPKSKVKEVSTFYIVKSAQDAKGRGPRSGGASGHAAVAGAGMSYVIRLGAWNCSCPAFTFSAFPAVSSSYISTYVVDAVGHAGSKGGIQAPEDCDDSWQFGGLSRDGMEGRGAVPCCKHLLACLLSEKWHSVLGTYVNERRVGSEEMAGLGADG